MGHHEIPGASCSRGSRYPRPAASTLGRPRLSRAIAYLPIAFPFACSRGRRINVTRARRRRQYRPATSCSPGVRHHRRRALRRRGVDAAIGHPAYKAMGGRAAYRRHRAVHRRRRALGIMSFRSGDPEAAITRSSCSRDRSRPGFSATPRRHPAVAFATIPWGTCPSIDAWCTSDLALKLPARSERARRARGRARLHNRHALGRVPRDLIDGRLRGAACAHLRGVHPLRSHPLAT